MEGQRFVTQREFYYFRVPMISFCEGGKKDA